MPPAAALRGPNFGITILAGVQGKIGELSSGEAAPGEALARFGKSCPRVSLDTPPPPFRGATAAVTVDSGRILVVTLPLEWYSCHSRLGT